MATKEFVPSASSCFVVAPAFPTEMTRDARYASLHRFVGSAQLAQTGLFGRINQESEYLNSHRDSDALPSVAFPNENQRRS
jgi:hypothetical protein